jgi:nucleoid DNA-binding protein
MNRKELIDALSTSTGSSKAHADRAIGALLDIISDTLKKGESLSLAVLVLSRFASVRRAPAAIPRQAKN